MATVVKSHPTNDLTVIEYNGMKDLTWIEIDFGADASGEGGPSEAVQAVLDVCNRYSTVVIRGDLHGGSSNLMMIAVEQSNASLDYDGGGAETLAEQIEDDIIALTDLSGASVAPIWDFTGVTCVVKTSLNFA